MDATELRQGDLYQIDGVGDPVEFSAIGCTGLAIVHPPGEPDMQSSEVVDPRRLVAFESVANAQEEAWQATLAKLSPAERRWDTSRGSGPSAAWGTPRVG